MLSFYKIINPENMKRFIFSLILLSILTLSCNEATMTGDTVSTSTDAPFIWENATVYFLLTDRFNNGNPGNDLNFNRNKPTAKLRGFMGGDIRE